MNRYGLIRFNKKTEVINKSMVAWGKGVIQLWALQNTPKTMVSIIINLDERKVHAEYIGTPGGFPIIHKNEEEFEYNVPEELYDVMSEDFDND